jgi:hypothetical protein
MRALISATVYFGLFLTIGYVAKRLLDRWTSERGLDVAEMQREARSRPQPRFLLGAWYRDEH